MKSFFKSSAIFVFAALTSTMFLLSSCDDEDAYLDVSDETVTFPAAGGSVTITVNANTDWTYSFVGGDWISDEKTATGITLTASANALSSGTRTSTMTVASSKGNITRTVAFNQPSSYYPYLSVSTTPVNFDPAGEEVLIEISTNVEDWTFSLTGGDGWLTGAKVTEGLKLTALENNDLPEGSSRSASLTIESVAADVVKSIALSQRTSFTAYLNLSVEPPIILNGAGDELIIEVSSSTTNWDVKSNQPWLEVERTGSNVKLTVQQNTGFLLSKPGDPAPGGSFAALRTAVLSFTSEEFPINKDVPVEQDRAVIEEGLPATWMLPEKAFDENASWRALDGTAGRGVGEMWVLSDEGAAVLKAHRAAPARDGTQQFMSYTTSNLFDGDRLLVYGMVRYDYYQMDIATLGIAAGSRLKIEGEMQSSSTGPRDFLFQYSTDQTTWTPINPITDGDFSYTVRMGSAVKTAIVQEFTVANAIPMGLFYIRMLISGPNSAGGGANIGDAGTSRICRPFYSSEANKVPLMKVSKL